MARNYSIAQLEQVGSMTDLLNDALNSVANQILQDKDTYPCLRSRNLDRIREARASLKLRNIQTANSFMRYISVYNSYTHRLVSSSFAGSLSQEEADFYYDILGERSFACQMRRIGEDYVTQPYKNATVYTFLFKLNTRPGDDPDLVIIDVNEDYFNSVIRSLRTTEKEQQILFLDDQNRVISAHIAEEGAEYFTLLDETEFDPASLPDSEEKSGAFSYSSGGLTDRFVSFSRPHKSGFTIVNILPYSSILTGLYPTALLTLLLALVALGFGYIISVRMSRMLYAPIQRLYDNYVSKDDSEKTSNELEELSRAFSEMYSRADRLEQGLISTYNDSKRLYLDYLLKGKFQEVNHSESVYRRLGIDLSAPFYTVILIECASLLESETQTDADLFISHYALENVTKEVVSQYGSTDILRIEENSFAVLLSLPEEKLPEGILSQLKTVSDVMRKEFSIETTICVGKTVETYLNINMCYEATRIALSSAAYKDRGSIFIAGTATETITAGQYYNKLHQKIAEYIRIDDIDSCSKEFDLALSSMENVSFQTAKTYFNHVMMTLLDDFSGQLEKNDSSFEELAAKLDSIMYAQNVRVMKRSMMDFLTLLMHLIALNRKGGNQDIVESAKEYIDKNYSSPDLSLRVLADLAGLSPPYFGKIFTSVTTFTFNDYLNMTRMNHAARMLTETKLPVNQISEAVGILNTNYFYSVFKKRFGTTPSAYRKSHSE